jgi:hypothetical protein
MVMILGKTGWCRWKNVGYVTTEAFECAEVTGNSVQDGETYRTAKQPTSTAAELYIINSPMPVDANMPGEYHPGPEVIAKYADDAPACGDYMYPQSGQGTLDKANTLGCAWAVIATGEVDATTKTFHGVVVHGASGLTPLRLDAPLYACGSAAATVLIPSDSGTVPCVCGSYVAGESVTVYDKIGVVGASLLAFLDNNGAYIPAGNFVYAERFGSKKYEAVTFGESTCTSDSDSDSDSSDSDSDSTSDSDSDSDSAGRPAGTRLCSSRNAPRSVSMT